MIFSNKYNLCPCFCGVSLVIISITILQIQISGKVSVKCGKKHTDLPMLITYIPTGTYKPMLIPYLPKGTYKPMLILYLLKHTSQC